MKQHSAIYFGILSGTVISIGIALLSMPILISKTYEIEISNNVINIFEIIGILLLFASVLSIGVLPIISNRTIKYSDGIKLGAISGITASLIIFILIGNLYSSLTLGVIPFIDYLVEPEKLKSIEPINDVLRPVVKDVISLTYLILIFHILIGVIISIIETIPSVWIMKKRIKQ
jgi:hypothetical protein